MILWGRGWLLGLILKEFDDLSVACTLTTCFPPIFHVASFTLRFPRTRVVPKEAMPWSKFLGLFKAPFDRPYKIWLNKHWRSKYGGCPPAVLFVNPFQYSLSLNRLPKDIGRASSSLLRHIVFLACVPSTIWWHSPLGYWVKKAYSASNFRCSYYNWQRLQIQMIYENSQRAGKHGLVAYWRMHG
jgi:hypothetical protein